MSLIICVMLKLIHTVTPDTTKLSCLGHVRFGGVNWIPDISRLLPTDNLKSEHVQSSLPLHTGQHTRHDKDRTVLSCLVRWCELSRPDRPRQVRSASECVGRRRYCRCDRRTHSEAERTCQAVGPTQFTPPDTTGLSCLVRRAV